MWEHRIPWEVDKGLCTVCLKVGREASRVLIYACAYIRTWATAKCCRRTDEICEPLSRCHISDVLFRIRFKILDAFLSGIVGVGRSCCAVMIDFHYIHGVPRTQSRRRRRLRVTARLHVQDAPQYSRYVRRFVAVTSFRSPYLPSFEICAVLGR